MEDNKKPTSEFENLVKEATGEIPTVNKEEQTSDIVNIDDVQIVGDDNGVEMPKPKVEAPAKEIVLENNSKKAEESKKEEAKVDDVQIVDDGSKVDLPQTKEQKESSIPQNVDISTSSQTIGTVKPDKQKSPFAMLFLFGILIVFIVFMPTAIDLFNKYFGTDLNIDSLNNPTKVDEKKEDDNEKQEIKMYDLKEETVITVGKIDFGGFKKENIEGYKITFYIKNNGNVLHKFDKKLYLEYYDDNNTFVGRTYLENVKEITGGISNNYAFGIDNSINNRATKIEVVQRTEDDYPVVELTDNQLICTNETNSIIYTFNGESKLTKIQDTYMYIKDDDSMKYNNDLITYKSKLSRLDSMDGIDAVVTETDNGFMATTAIDYQYADYSKISSNTDYYIKETYAKTISFEMNAKGYTCR